MTFFYSPAFNQVRSPVQSDDAVAYAIFADGDTTGFMRDGIDVIARSTVCVTVVSIQEKNPVISRTGLD